MRMSPAGLIAAGFLVASGVSHAVTITTNGVSVSTTVAGNTVIDNPSSQQISGGGSLISAQGNALTQNDLGGGSWEFNGLNTAALLSALRDATGANNPVTASASVTYTIAFTLGVGESADVTFGADYDLQESNLDGQISWSLSGPQAGFSGSVGTPASGSIATQQVTLNTAGSYTFTLAGSIPGPIDRSQSASITLSNIDFQIVAVPEPSAAILGSLGVGLLLFRRRRNRA